MGDFYGSPIYFQLPLIKPYVRFSLIRLSYPLHQVQLQLSLSEFQQSAFKQFFNCFPVTALVLVGTTFIVV